jgi:hypothetical protein
MTLYELIKPYICLQNIMFCSLVVHVFVSLQLAVIALTCAMVRTVSDGEKTRMKPDISFCIFEDEQNVVVADGREASRNYVHVQPCSMCRRPSGVYIFIFC